MANKKFLEEYPLYRKFATEFCSWHDLDDLSKPAIHMYCNQCEADQTFNMVNEYYEVDYMHNAVILNKIVRALYRCSACGEFERRFFIRFELGKIEKKNKEGEIEASDVVFAEKVGQHPSWEIAMDKELESILGPHSEYYKRGLICESQGYGIGAFAYYRRIVEEIIGKLLVSIEDIIDASEKEKYGVALAAVQKTTVAKEKINLVKDLLPASLRPDGLNPLSALHSALSEGLHAETEEECLEYAEAIRGALVFLVNRLVRTKSDNQIFTASMKKILEKKGGKA